MLVSMKEILEHANEENYAVPAPVTQTELNARTAIKCAEEMNSPIILLIPLICSVYPLSHRQDSLYHNRQVFFFSEILKPYYIFL